MNYQLIIENSQATIESLRQQLADSQKREVVLRDALEMLFVGTNHDEWDGVAINTIESALAATADLAGLIVCEKESVAYVADLAGNKILTWVGAPEDVPLYRAWEPKEQGK